MSAVCLLLTATLPVQAQPARPLFVFHNEFWINLHHHLHALARAEKPIGAPLPATATFDEQQTWSAAVDHYRTAYGKRSLLFDEALVRVAEALRDRASQDDLSGAAIDATLRGHLKAAAPMYRRYRWRTHREANAQFVEALQPLLKLVFHEASHRWDFVLIDEVLQAAREGKLKTPGPLWHALLFYNAGAIVTDTLAGAGTRDYEMYMFAQKTFDGPGWHAAIAKHWTAFLAGKTSRRDTIAAILRELAPP